MIPKEDIDKVNRAIKKVQRIMSKQNKVLPNLHINRRLDTKQTLIYIRGTGKDRKHGKRKINRFITDKMVQCDKHIQDEEIHQQDIFNRALKLSKTI